MKTISFFSILTFLFLNQQVGNCQKKVPTLKAKSNVGSVRIGKAYYKDAWQLSPKPENDPDVIGSEVAEAGTVIGVYTDLDSFSMVVKQGEKYLFKVVINDKDTVWGLLKGGEARANFTEGYKKANEGKTLVDVPKCYELVNIVMALTPTGIRDSNMIEHDVPYYNQVQAYFNAFKNHRAVLVMDSLLKKDEYYHVKMDAFSFEFNKKGILQKKTEYRRIASGSDNSIEPYIPLLQDFAKATQFLKFYKKNQPFYASMIRAFQDSLGVPDMQNWLNRNFPSTRYNCFKIVFSPLVSGNQSTTDFENNGFKEGQPHVNFTESSYDSRKYKFSEKANNIRRGDIVFTELNHLFENPEFDKEVNLSVFNKIPFNFAVYAEKGKAASYYDSPLSCTAEYMNWALVSLRYLDFAPKEDIETLLSRVENTMVTYRGFKKFKEFNRFLIDIYQKRPQGKVVADLYPQIIEWFRVNNQ
jgi:hypothetical protein